MLSLVSFYDLNDMEGRLGMEVRDSVYKSVAWFHHSQLKRNWGWDKTTSKLQSFVVIENDCTCVGIVVIDDSRGIYGKPPFADMWTNVRPEYREETIKQMLEVCQQMGIKDAHLSCSIEDKNFAETLEVLGAQKLPLLSSRGNPIFNFSLEPAAELSTEGSRELIHSAN